MKDFLSSRSVVEVMTLAFTFLISFVIVIGTVAVAVAEIFNPEVDTSQVLDALTGIITGILGALLGLLAGKSEAMHVVPPKNSEVEK